MKEILVKGIRNTTYRVRQENEGNFDFLLQSQFLPPKLFICKICLCFFLNVIKVLGKKHAQHCLEQQG
jgi:hypothetical protein